MTGSGCRRGRCRTSGSARRSKATTTRGGLMSCARQPAAIRFLSLEPLLGPLPSLDLASIDWVIVGGESGPGHRPLDLDWVRQIRDRCLELGIPLFFKQVGGRTPKAGGRTLDGRTWDQMPTPRAPIGGAA